MIKEIDLIENKDVRENFIARVEVLDRVKELNTLADTDYMTTRQVAEFYEVDKTTINQVYIRFSDELIQDGVIKAGAKKILNKLRLDKMSKRKIAGGIQIGEEYLSYNTNNLYPKRAVLRVGMLLRDSLVAKEVRTMLLNVYHDAEKEKPGIIENINKEYEDEMELTAELGEAILTGNMEDVIIITTRINEIKNRRLRETEEKLAKSEEEKAQIITNSTTIQEARQVIRRIVNIIANKKYGDNFSLVWNELHKQANYKLGINIKNRGGTGSLMSKYIEEELQEVEKIAKSWASKLGLDLQEALELA